MHFNTSALMAPYLHTFSAVVQKKKLFGAIKCKISIIIRNFMPSSKGVVWDEFSEQHQQKASRQEPYLMPNRYFFGAYKVQIICIF